MLCHCLSLISSSLSKQQLKSGLSVEEVAAVARAAYLAGPEARLGEPKSVQASPSSKCKPPRKLCRAPASSAVPVCRADG